MEANQFKTEGIAGVLIGIALRIYIILIWCFFYIGFVWFLEYVPIALKVYGFTFLLLGIILVLLPAKLAGEKNWSYMFWGFNGLFFLWFVF